MCCVDNVVIIVCCLSWFVICCSVWYCVGKLSGVRSSLFVVRCLLCVVSCMLFVVRCMFVAGCPLIEVC